MVEEKKLESYSKRYEKLKEEIVETSIVKSDLERQQRESNNKIVKLSNDIRVKGSNILFDKAHKLQEKKIFLKNQLIRNILADLLAGTLLISLAYIVIELPLILVLGISSIITISQIISNISTYKKNIKKYSILHIDKSDLEKSEITELAKERNKELSKNIEIQNCSNIVNERLNNLGELKLDIENLIICLFSSLDNIIKNQSNQKEPFKTWINIGYEEDEPKLEISSTLKRVRNKKEEK